MIFKEELDKRTSYVESILHRYLSEPQEAGARIREAMNYSVFGGGKRLRPILMLETYRLFGGKNKALIEPFFAAIEMIHTYSLVHDDLPAMDNDDTRRGRKATHIVYGEAFGILAGDALLSFAFETACSAFDACPKSGNLIGKSLQILARKAGVSGMIGGQAADVESCEKAPTKERLDFIDTLKTSALMEAAMMIGACLCGASKQDIHYVEDIARKVGLAFQIRDDILDVTGEKGILGKSVHSDEKNEKTTYVTFLGIERSEELVKEYLSTARQKLKRLGPDAEFLEKLLESLTERQK